MEGPFRGKGDPRPSRGLKASRATFSGNPVKL
jgi:hypothetical protein